MDAKTQNKLWYNALSRFNQIKMTLSETARITKHICRLLKVTDVTYPIGRTNKGNLGLSFTGEGDDFNIMLDSIPLLTTSPIDHDNNIELKKLLTKYLFDKEDVVMFKGLSDSEQETMGLELAMDHL
jgi:hypothetical protein